MARMELPWGCLDPGSYERYRKQTQAAQEQNFAIIHPIQTEQDSDEDDDISFGP